MTTPLQRTRRMVVTWSYTITPEPEPSWAYGMYWTATRLMLRDGVARPLLWEGED